MPTVHYNIMSILYIVYIIYHNYMIMVQLKNTYTHMCLHTHTQSDGKGEVKAEQI